MTKREEDIVFRLRTEWSPIMKPADDQILPAQTWHAMNRKVKDDAADEITSLRSVNAALVEALTRCLEWIESDEAAHGRTFGAGVEARAALAKALPPPPVERK